MFAGLADAQSSSKHTSLQIEEDLVQVTMLSEDNASVTATLQKESSLGSLERSMLISLVD